MDYTSFLRKKEYHNFLERLQNVTKELLVENVSDEITKIVINPDAERTICFIAGIHGDEVGGPYGVLEYLEEECYVSNTKRVIIYPLVNADGFIAKTRENGNKEDINRHFRDEELKDECKQIWESLKDEKIDLLHTLHEDVDMEGFYVYYTIREDIARDVKTLASKYFPIATEKELYDDKVYEGLCPLPHVERGTLEEKLFLDHDVNYYTTESPGKAALFKRTQFNKEVIQLMINSF